MVDNSPQFSLRDLLMLWVNKVLSGFSWADTRIGFNETSDKKKQLPQGARSVVVCYMYMPASRESK